LKERSANCDQYQEWGGETIIVFTIPDTQENILRNSKMAPLGTDLENHILDDLVFSPKNQIFEKNGKVSFIGEGKPAIFEGVNLFNSDILRN